MFDSPNPHEPTSPPTQAATMDVSAAPVAAEFIGGYSVSELAPSLDGLLGEVDEDLCLEIIRLEGARRQLDARRARVLAALDADGVTDSEHGMRTGQWIAATCGLPSAQSKTVVRQSKQLMASFPILYAALEAAAISWAHIEVVLRVSNPRIISNLSAIQNELLVLARNYTFDQWAREMMAIAQMIDIDGGHDPDKDRTSSLSIAQTSDGMCHVGGWLTPEVRLPFLHALNLIADKLFRQAKTDRETISRAHRPACSGPNEDGSCDCGANDQDGSELEMPSRSELRAMALAEMARLAMGALSAKHRNALPEITIVITPDTATISADGEIIPEELMRQLAPDAMWRFLRTDVAGKLLNLTRVHRHVTADLRHALAIRDGGCVFPGCDAPHQHCDAHHVVHWSANGTTDPDNCVLVCRYHHGVTHRKGWSMSAAGSQRFWWTTPAGRIIHSQRNHQPPTDSGGSGVPRHTSGSARPSASASASPSAESRPQP